MTKSTRRRFLQAAAVGAAAPLIASPNAEAGDAPASADQRWAPSFGCASNI